MDLRRLRYFVAVAEELHFTRAAERLHMAQPPLSNQIRQLEKELGVQLFYRNKRNVRLTEAGRLWLEETRRLLAHFEQAVGMVRRVGHGEVGRLAVGCVPSACNSVVPPFLRAFGDRFPDVKISLREMDPDRVLQSLRDGRIDVGFLYLPFEGGALDFRPVSREPFVVALPDTHPLASETEVTLDMLANESFVLTPTYQGAGLRGRIVELCRRAGFVPRVVQEAWLMQTAVSLVASGIGVTLVPASLQNLQRTGVVYRTIEGLSPEVQTGAVWRRDDALPVLRSFLEVVEDICGQGPPDRGEGGPVAALHGSGGGE